MPSQKVIRTGRRIGDEKVIGTRIEPIIEDRPLPPNDISDGSVRKRNSGHRRKRISSSKSKSIADPPGAKICSSKKSVHWNPKVTKKRHIQIADIKEKEKENVWYTKEETKIILAMAKATVKMMMSGQLLDNIDYCSRGLEGKTLIGAKKRGKYKQAVRSSVMKEQEMQRMSGINRPEDLAKVSLGCTETPIAKARNRAAKDEQEAREYLLHPYSLLEYTRITRCKML